MKLPETTTIAVTGAGDDHTIKLLESLIHSIHHTQSFKSKWFIIQSKLSDIKTLISDVSDYPQNPISGDLLHSLSQTLSHALSLFATCHTPSAGKLKTQNDADSIFTQLDNHHRDLDVVISSGVLVVSKLKASKHESVRVKSRRLVTQLQIGSVESRTFAMDSLLKLLDEDDKNVVIVVVQGVVPVLVQLLDAGGLPEDDKMVGVLGIWVD